MTAKHVGLRQALRTGELTPDRLYLRGGDAIWKGITTTAPDTLAVGLQAMERIVTDDSAPYDHVHAYMGALTHRAYRPLYERWADGYSCGERTFSRLRGRLGTLLADLLVPSDVGNPGQNFIHIVRNTGRLLLLRDQAREGITPIPAAGSAQSGPWTGNGQPFPQVDSFLALDGGVMLPCDIRLHPRERNETLHPGVHYVNLGSDLLRMARAHGIVPMDNGKPREERMKETVYLTADYLAREAIDDSHARRDLGLHQEPLNSDQQAYLTAATTHIVERVGATRARQTVG